MSAPVRLLVVSGAPDPKMVEAAKTRQWDCPRGYSDCDINATRINLAAVLAAAPAVGVEEIARALVLAIRSEPWSATPEEFRTVYLGYAEKVLAALAARKEG